MTTPFVVEENPFEAYEQYLVPRFFAPGAQILTELSEMKQGERVLDVACATGSVARAAAAKVGPSGKVVGLDINQGMLDMARKVSAELYPEIEWRHGDAMALPYPDGAFDVVLCQQALQFFPDRSAALREMRRVLAGGGRLAFAFLRSLTYNLAYGCFVQALEHHGWHAAAGLMGSPFPTMRIEWMRALVSGAGFLDVRIQIGIGPVRYPSAREFVRQEIAATSAVLPSNQPLAMPSKAVYESVVAELESSLAEYTDDAGLVFPTETYLVTAHR
jgi:SAM-dependent methyltransferase